MPHLSIPARDGYPISSTIRRPETDIKGVIQINCGTGIPQYVYSNLATYLTDSGYVTVTYDYRGIGASKPKDLKGFRSSMEDWGKLDMAGVFDWVNREFPTQHKIMIGHSMGGQLVGLLDQYEKIDQLFLIASSTGYWRDMSAPFKWLMPPLWFVFIPVTTAVYGYANAKKIRQGENLPKGVALQWRDWCTNPNYFEDHFRNAQTDLFFEKLEIPIKSFQIEDDPIANEVTANKLLAYYKNARIEVERVRPQHLGVKKISHTGFFSRQFKDTLWRRLKDDIEGNVEC